MSRRLAPAILLLAAVLPAVLDPAQGQTPVKRVALVIGNAGYATKPLPNCKNDAQAMAVALRELGFSEVQVVTDATLDAMTDALAAFRRQATDALAVVYYSGHGVQSDGRNYLIPVGASISTRGQLRSRALDLQELLDELDGAKYRIVILDACRDDPLPAEAKSGKKGLIPLRGPLNSLVAFAASDGQTADANVAGKLSTYTEELLKNLAVPGLDLERIFKRTLSAVADRTDNAQIPDAHNRLRDDIVLRSGNATPPRPATSAENPPPPIGTALKPGSRAGERRQLSLTGSKTTLDVVWVPAGSFTMGDDSGAPAERPAHRVTLSRGFSMLGTEATNGLYGAFLAANPQHPKPLYWEDVRFNGSRQPVVGVTWDDSQALCAWLSKAANAPCALPTEAQWEYAARGPQSLKYPWGDSEPDFRKAVFGLPFDIGKPDEVGSCPGGASWCGALDLSGNVWEWCRDWYDDNYYRAQGATDPTGPAAGRFHVFRGGAWLNPAISLRGAARNKSSLDPRGIGLGFRVVWPAPP